VQSTKALACALLFLAAVVTAAVPPATAAPTEGFLYGRIVTRDGNTYQGRLRWEEEEAFWGDYFNSTKEHNPWVSLAPRRERDSRRRTIEIFGVEIGTIGGWRDGHAKRQFVARFGDIAKIEPGRGDRVLVTLKNGTPFELDGGSNDVGATVRVWDGRFGVVEVEWRRIASIELLPTPPLGAAPQRLHGTVQTRVGDFTGFVQWDQDECLGSDVLDGETRDGDMKIPMGNIRAIEKRSSSSSRVYLRDGRDVTLSGTNDVNRSNRGIFVDDPRYGRVLVSWEAFERVDFSDGGSGPGYGDYPAGAPLSGTVTVADGRRLTGRLVYDLDESETTEMLDGEWRDIDYSIPFGLVAAVVPRGNASRVILRSGEELVLEGTADVSPDNAGMLVFAGGSENPTYVPWRDVERIDFDAPTASWPPVRR
jgi:hypothetical protein